MTEEKDFNLETVDEQAQEKDQFTIGILGDNSTAESIRYAFTKPRNDVIVGKTEDDIQDIIDAAPHIVFICFDTKVNEDGVTEATELESAALRILSQTHGGLVIKTSMPTELVDRICAKNKRIVYHPDIISMMETKEEKYNEQIFLLGGHGEATLALQEIYYRFSTFMPRSMAHISAVEASLVEQSISAMLAMKSVFYNQLYDVVQEYGGDYHTIATYIGSDGRVGAAGTLIPDMDYKRGCSLPRAKKAVKDLVKFNERFTLLQEVDRMNESYQNRED